MAPVLLKEKEMNPFATPLRGALPSWITKSFIVSVFALAASLSFGQYNHEIPNYIFAQNAKPVVIWITNMDYHHEVATEWGSAGSRTEPDYYDSKSEALFAEITRVIMSNLEGLGFKPKALVAIHSDELHMNADAYNHAVEGELAGINPYYTIAINHHNEKNLKKLFKEKGRLFPEDLTQVDIKIDHWHDPKPHTIYVIDWHGHNYKEVVDKLKEDINKKQRSYFRTQLRDSELRHE